MSRSKEYLSKEELEQERTPYELWDWLLRKTDEIFSTDEGREYFRLQKGHLAKKLVEEVIPLARLGRRKFGDTDRVLLRPFIGSQNYDAKIIDKRNDPASETYVEITQAHEGEDSYWHRRELWEKGSDMPHAPVTKKGKGKNKTVSITREGNSVEEPIQKELERILEAAQRKTGKSYPPNTWLIISFDDTPPFEREVGDKKLDSFVKEELLSLDLRFSALYLVGMADLLREWAVPSSLARGDATKVQ